MSTQVVRVESFSKGSLSNIGKEVDRADNEHRNKDIDSFLTYLNRSYKDAPTGLYNRYNEIRAELNVQGKETKKCTAFEGMIITADKAFFENLGWQKGEPEPEAVKEFFDRSYAYALKQIGYLGTDKNILSAKVHYDETTPHLQLYYLPITEKWQDKVYAKDESGKVLRSDKGTPIQARDKDGKIIYNEFEDKTAPKLSRTEFWRVRGGKHSYRRLQDEFHERIGKEYSLDRGEIGSDKEHRTKNEWEAERLKKDIEAVKDLTNRVKQVDISMKPIPFSSENVIVNKNELVPLIEAAKSYEANRFEIMELEKNKRLLKRRENQINLKEEYLNREIEKQKNLNEINFELKKENSELKKAVIDKDNEIIGLRDKLKQLTESFNQKIEESTRALKNVIQSLVERLERFQDYFKCAVQAIGLLKYDRGKYKTALTEDQGHLVDAIKNYASNRLRDDKRDDLADEIDKTVRLSKGVQNEIYELKPKHDRGMEL